MNSSGKKEYNFFIYLLFNSLNVPVPLYWLRMATTIRWFSKLCASKKKKQINPLTIITVDQKNNKESMIVDFLFSLQHVCSFVSLNSGHFFLFTLFREREYDSFFVSVKTNREAIYTETLDFILAKLTYR